MPINDARAEELIRRVAQGDDVARGELLDACQPRLRQMITARMDPRLVRRVDPSDVIQETFMAALQQLPKYCAAPVIPFYPWIRRIAWQKLVHLHQRHLDAAKRQLGREQLPTWVLSDDSVARLASSLADSQTSVSQCVVRREERDEVQAVLRQLAELDREVLLQRYVEQLTIKDIAVNLGSTEAAIQMRHMRALQKMQRLLRRQSS